MLKYFGPISITTLSTISVRLLCSHVMLIIGLVYGIVIVTIIESIQSAVQLHQIQKSELQQAHCMKMSKYQKQN